MKILVLLTDLFDKVGGIQTFNRSLIKALDDIAVKKNWDITVLALNDNQKKDTAKQFHLNKTKYIAFKGSRFQFAASVFAYAKGSSIIFFGHVNFLPIAYALRFINPKVYMYLTVYGIDIWKKLSLIQKLGINKINKILSISNYTKQIAVSLNLIDESKFLVLPCTLDTEYGKQVVLKSKNELSLPQGKMILTVSRLAKTEKLKNIDLVIKALPLILKETPDVYYVIAGDGDDRTRLENISKEVGVKDKVVFTGKVSDEILSSYYNLCNVFVLPSEKEGFGIVFLEAMYYSKPCIGANAGGIPEVIEDSKTGLLIEPGNANSLVSSIIKLLEDEKLCYSMGKSGKERLEKEFSFERFKNRLENLLCY